MEKRVDWAFSKIFYWQFLRLVRDYLTARCLPLMALILAGCAKNSSCSNDLKLLLLIAPLGAGVVGGGLVEDGDSEQRLSPEMHSLQVSSKLVQLLKRLHWEAPEWNVNQRQPSVETHVWRQADPEVDGMDASRTPRHSPSTKQTGSGGVQLCSPKSTRGVHLNRHTA